VTPSHKKLNPIEMKDLAGMKKYFAKRVDIFKED
jgi:hypothetical protein